MKGAAKNVRIPAVAGMFYPGDPKEMKHDLDRFLTLPGGHSPAAAVVSPHAGWYYSGHVAGALFAAVDVPDRVILLGPNHRGSGAPLALDPHDAWRFPFGDVPMDKELGQLLLAYCPELEADATAHGREHSLEVIVPFLHARNPRVAIAAVCIGTFDTRMLIELAHAAARAARETGALIVASSDMTHYLPDTVAREIDGRMIETLKRMDPDEVLATAERDGSLCGGGPVFVALSAAKENGARTATLVKYATSGDIEGKRDAVVGYGAFAIS